MKKSSHSFVCRDDVWERVEALATHRGVSTDDVIQAALVQLFVRKKRPPMPGASSTSASASMSTRMGQSTIGGRLDSGIRSTLPPPVRGREGSAGASSSVGPRPLYLYCEGDWYVIDKDEFVIGRGKKYSDLAIKDANISRRHCAIARVDGRYYLRDLGSTNGVELNGVRVDDHEILEDSVYQLCNHELRFSFVEPDGPIVGS